MSPREATAEAPPVERIGDPFVEPDPWSRLGWLMWGVWLVFLVFPLLAVLQSGAGVPAQVYGVAMVLAFAAVYVVLVRRMDAIAESGRPWLAVLVLALFPLALVPVIGIQALGMTPFLSSFSAFALPRPLAWWACGTLLTVALGSVLLTRDWEMAWFLIILFAVTIGTCGGRLMADRGEEYGRSQRDLALTQERERVARDVHDVLGHSLTVVTLKAQLAERLVDVDPERAKHELAELQQLSREALGEIRATVGGLRAARLDDEVERAATALATAGIAFDRPEDVLVVDPARRTVVAWALREAVTNVVRHSGARHCRVELASQGLLVRDDGRGADPRRVGNGLNGLRERVESAGGTLCVGPGPDGRGTQLEVRW